MNIKDIVNKNTCVFNHYRNGNLFYTVAYNGELYIFPVQIDDLENATVNLNEKAITLMRYIRKAIEAKTFIVYQK